MTNCNQTLWAALTQNQLLLTGSLEVKFIFDNPTGCPRVYDLIFLTGWCSLLNCLGISASALNMSSSSWSGDKGLKRRGLISKAYPASIYSSSVISSHIILCSLSLATNHLHHLMSAPVKREVRWFIALSITSAITFLPFSGYSKVGYPGGASLMMNGFSLGNHSFCLSPGKSRHTISYSPFPFFVKRKT